MKWFGIGLLLFAGGCAPYLETQSALVGQARRGLVLIAEHHEQRSAMVDELHDLRRQRLDEAFDADVVERAARQELEAEWVIEHRRGYAAAVDLLWQARAASDEADRIATQNIEATDAALRRLDELIGLMKGVER